MLCGASTCFLILILCIIASMVVITSERPATEIQGIRTTGFIDNHRRVMPQNMREYVNNAKIENIDKMHSPKDESVDRDFHLNRSKPILLETAKLNFNLKEAVNALTRRKRSYGFEIVSDVIIPEGTSIDMKTLFARQKTTRKLYHQSSSTLLQLLPNGDIIGTAIFNKYCVLLLKSVDHVDNKTLVKIFGKSTGRYIAMTSKGVLYTTKDPRNKETDFLHEYAPDTHDAYISQRYGRYITLSGNNVHPSPRRGRRAKGKRTPKGSRFLLLDVSETELRKSNEEEVPSDSHSSKSDTMSNRKASKMKKKHKKGAKQKKVPCRRISHHRRKKHRRRCKTRKKNKHHPAKLKQERNRHKIRTTTSDYVEVT